MRPPSKTPGALQWDVRPTFPPQTGDMPSALRIARNDASANDILADHLFGSYDET